MKNLRSMDSAPKDGTWILVPNDIKYEGLPPWCIVHWGELNFNPGWVTDEYGPNPDGIRIDDPEGWLPLPE